MAKNTNTNFAAINYDEFVKACKRNGWNPFEGMQPVAQPVEEPVTQLAKAEEGRFWCVPKVQENVKKNGFELVFPAKPAKAFAQYVRSFDFAFNNRTKVWYKSNRDGIAKAEAEAIRAKLVEAMEEPEAKREAFLTGKQEEPEAKPVQAKAQPAKVQTESKAIAAGMHFVDSRLFTVKSFPDDSHVRVADESGKERNVELHEENGQQFIIVNNRRAVLYR